LEVEITILKDQLEKIAKNIATCARNFELLSKSKETELQKFASDYDNFDVKNVEQLEVTNSKYFSYFIRR
jgi:hypothetical protein